MTDAVIRVRGIGKRYEIGERGYGYKTLRESLASLFARTRAEGSAKAGANGHHPKTFWALKDINFDVQRGEIVGIIGRNGAGKSTLLKILSRITDPTEGEVEIDGRVGSLLEVGTGFHPELTGRENIFLNGAILGMKRAEIAARFDEIVAFAGTEKFLDTPVKYYSSGMYVRLAFGVAAHLEPEILIVDEVLSVGDAEFQKKCLGKMGDVAHSGRTVLLVTHQINQLRRLCQRVIWLETGKVQHDGDSSKVITDYESTILSRESKADLPLRNGAKAQFTGWEIARASGDHHTLLSLGPMCLRLHLRVTKPVKFVHQGTALFSQENQLLWAAGVDNLEFSPGEFQLEYELPTLPLRPGSYRWLATLYEAGETLDYWNCVPEMLVATTPATHPCDEWTGILNIPYEFAVNEVEKTICKQ